MRQREDTRVLSLPVGGKRCNRVVGCSPFQPSLPYASRGLLLHTLYTNRAFQSIYHFKKRCQSRVLYSKRLWYFMGFLSKARLWQICFPVNQFKLKFPLGSCSSTQILLKIKQRLCPQLFFYSTELCCFKTALLFWTCLKWGNGPEAFEIKNS